MTNKQEAAALTKSFNSIWRMGDKCECSIKHIRWAIAALARGLKWKDGMDYPTPWATDDDNHANQWLPIAKKLLAKKWDKITAKRDLWGAEKFWEICKLTDFSNEFYYEQY